MCRFCGAQMHAPPAHASLAPQGPGYAPQGPGYAPQGPGYAPQGPGYAPHQQQQQQQQQQGYAQPQGPGGYGAPLYPQQQGYAQPQPYPQPGYHPPQGYAQPPVAGFGGAAPVQPFGGAYHSHVDRGWWGSSFGTFFWARLAIAAIAIGVSLIIACVSAIANG